MDLPSLHWTLEGWSLDQPVEGSEQTRSFITRKKLDSKSVVEYFEESGWRKLCLRPYEVFDTNELKKLMRGLGGLITHVDFVIEDDENLEVDGEEFDHDYSVFFEPMKSLINLRTMTLWDEFHVNVDEICAGIRCLVPQLERVRGYPNFRSTFTGLYPNVEYSNI